MKATGFDEGLYRYLATRRTPDDEIARALRAETQQRFGDLARMLIAPEQGTLLGILIAAIGARRVIEIGTFTGYSALSMARVLPREGKLLALDVSNEYTALAHSYWERAGIADRIEVRIAPALETLRALPLEEPFDFAFVDAEKTEYRAYYEELLPRMRQGALIGVDNVLWGGRVVRVDDTSEKTVAIRAFNDHIANDDRVDSVMLAVSDGLTLIRKR